MDKNNDEWEYCQITYRTSHNLGGGEHAGLNLGLLWFEPEANGPNDSYEAGKSPETPFVRESDGFPNQSNPIYLSLHQQLVDILADDGWQPLSDQGASWWQRRFKRKPQEAARPLLQRVLGYFTQRNPPSES